MNIEQLIGLFLENEEFEKDINVIMDSEIAYDIATCLKDDFKRKFFEEYVDNLDYEFEELLENNDILSVAVMYTNGKPIYYLQEVIYGEDDTLEFDSDIAFVQDDLLDIIDIEKLDGQVLTFYYKDLDDENESDIGEELGNEFDKLIDQALEDIEQLQEENPDFCLHCYLKENLGSKFYLLGYNNGLRMLREGINEILETK